MASTPQPESVSELTSELEAPPVEPKAVLTKLDLNTNQYDKPDTKGKEWTDQETLLLLEALEMFKDDWNKVRLQTDCKKSYSLLTILC